MNVARRTANIEDLVDELIELYLAQVAELHRFLHGFLIYHLGRIPKGRETALAEATPGQR